MLRNQTPMSRGMFQQQRPLRGTPAIFGERPGWPGQQMRGETGSRGLLSRLFQKQAAPQSAAMFSRGAEQTSLLQTIASPQKIGNFLSQTQQVLNTAQQFGPIIQQYGPIVKNLPAMWKIYQGFRTANDDENEVTNTEEENNLEANQVFAENDQAKLNEDSINEESTEIRSTPKCSGESLPKLYV